MNSKKVIGIIAVLAVAALVFVGAGAAVQTTSNGSDNQLQVCDQFEIVAVNTVPTAEVATEQKTTGTNGFLNFLLNNSYFVLGQTAMKLPLFDKIAEKVPFVQTVKEAAFEEKLIRSNTNEISEGLLKLDMTEEMEADGKYLLAANSTKALQENTFASGKTERNQNVGNSYRSLLVMSDGNSNLNTLKTDSNLTFKYVGDSVLNNKQLMTQDVKKVDSSRSRSTSGADLVEFWNAGKTVSDDSMKELNSERTELSKISKENVYSRIYSDKNVILGKEVSEVKGASNREESKVESFSAYKVSKNTANDMVKGVSESRRTLVIGGISQAYQDTSRSDNVKVKGIQAAGTKLTVSLDNSDQKALSF